MTIAETEEIIRRADATRWSMMAQARADYAEQLADAEREYARIISTLLEVKTDA